MKYIISGSEFTPVIVIGYDVSHYSLKQSLLRGAHISGAGHFRIIEGKLQVYGKSIGLGIVPGEKDAETLAAYLGIGYENVLPNETPLSEEIT